MEENIIKYFFEDPNGGRWCLEEKTFYHLLKKTQIENFEIKTEKQIERNSFNKHGEIKLILSQKSLLQ